MEPAGLEEERVAPFPPPLDLRRDIAGIPSRHRVEEPCGVPAVAGIPHQIGDRPASPLREAAAGRLPDPANQGEVAKEGRCRPIGVPGIEREGTPGLDDVARPGRAGHLAAEEDVLERTVAVSGEKVVPEPPCLLVREAADEGRPGRPPVLIESHIPGQSWTLPTFNLPAAQRK